MQLGSILQEQTGTPCVSHPVEFSLLKMTANGKMRFRVKALMFPVTEAERLTSARIAVDSLRALPEYKNRNPANCHRFLWKCSIKSASTSSCKRRSTAKSIRCVG